MQQGLVPFVCWCECREITRSALAKTTADFIQAGQFGFWRYCMAIA